MNSLKDILITEARLKGICKDGFQQMSNFGIDGLVDYYVANPDWCMERNYPTLAMLTDSFADIEDKGVYVNKVFNGETFSHLQTYVFHNCKGTINVAMDYDNAVIPMLYFGNGCDIRIECNQSNTPQIIVPLYVFGDNNIIANDSSNAIFKYYYSALK